MDNQKPDKGTPRKRGDPKQEKKSRKPLLVRQKMRLYINFINLKMK